MEVYPQRSLRYAIELHNNQRSNASEVALQDRILRQTAADFAAMMADGSYQRAPRRATR